MSEQGANAGFTRQLKKDFGEEIPQADRARAEKDLGENSLQYQLTRGGFRQLLAALDRGRQQGG